jgi:hypothetical protein
MAVITVIPDHLLALIRHMGSAKKDEESLDFLKKF